MALNYLPPIILQKAEKIIIDGYHRYLAYKLEKKETIPVIFKDIPKEDILWKAIKLNAKHGLTLDNTEKRSLAQRFIQNGKNVKDISLALSVSDQAVLNWTKDQRKTKANETNLKILDLWLACVDEEEIAKQVGYSRETIVKWVDKVKNQNLGKLPQFFDRTFKLEPDDLQRFNVWKTFKLDPNQLKYNGQTPQPLIENLLYYFTNPFDVVVDPMAGAGTVGRVCKDMLRRYLMFDIDPLYDAIQKNDMIKGIPLDKRKFKTGYDFIFLDPPYYKQVKYKQNSFSESIPKFYESITIALKNCYNVLRKDGILVLMLKPMGLHNPSSPPTNPQNEFEWADLTLDSYGISRKIGYTIYKRIMAPLSTQQYSNVEVNIAKRAPYLLNTLRDILVFKK